MAEQRLPTVNGDDGTWGGILNTFLDKEHYNDGTDNPAANGGHEKVTLRPGTSSAGTAPLKFSLGSLLTTPETGAIEFLNDRLYFTQTTGTTRKTVATYDDTAGAAGDIYYRDSGGNLIRLGIGATANVLTVSGGVPVWAIGGNSRSINVISTATTAGANTATDYVYVVSGTTTLTLPTAVGNSNLYTVTNVGTNVVTVATTLSQTINSSSTATLPISNMSLDFLSNGSDWIVQ
ncbi:MAG: hypothetical protein EOT05_04195 [Candidatus Microsaccharimonas sossegonensis]|uniref:Uncharacterized protein n=1 Tax=Candidatus Microsaccharimonas sossegonensis TaxID=2506948 RepID=A0A4Q0AID9_9BACT|nr:MAG: hypothetical protein EOT05_04195 [Candidatus Microsaccharimonas sossegonensis]